MGAFVHSWNIHVAERRAWIEEMAERILQNSGLPASGSGPISTYVDQFRLALFICNRLRKRATPSLVVKNSQPYASLSDSMANYGAGSILQIEQLQTFLNSMLVSEKRRAEKLDADLSRFVR